MPSEPHSKEQKNAGAPAVVLDKSGTRVRLRNLGYSIEGCISTSKEEIRYKLEPNKWTEVRPEVYDLLKRKFERPQTMEVPDWEPGGEGQRAEKARRVEEHQEYILEFGDER